MKSTGAILGAIVGIVGIVVLSGIVPGLSVIPGNSAYSCPSSTDFCAGVFIAVANTTVSGYVNGTYSPPTGITAEVYLLDIAVYVSPTTVANGQNVTCGPPISSLFANCSIPAHVVFGGGGSTGSFSAHFSGQIPANARNTYYFQPTALYTDGCFVFFGACLIPYFQAATIGSPTGFVVPPVGTGGSGTKAGCMTSCAAVVPNFNYVANGLAVNFTDATTFDQTVLFGFPSWSFGDGSTGAGVSTSHAYAKAGKYSVKETVKGVEPSGQTLTQSISLNVSVVAPNTPPPSNNTTTPPPKTTGGTSPPPPPAKLGIATPLGLGLIFGGFGFAGISLVRIGGKWAALIGGIVLFFVGTALGYGVGLGI